MMGLRLMQLVLSSVVVARAADVVRTSHGYVRGVTTPRYRSFRGIPFASPPVGSLRWRPPMEMAPWSGVRAATSYRHNCMQDDRFTPAQPFDTLSEDCLYLNVWTPPNATGASSLPVLFWVHGGSFTGGGANESRLNGTWIQAAGYDMIVVTTNYRLNIFGFLGGAALRTLDPLGSTGNYGIQDQRAALKWVQANIAAFGGDPKRVMLCGESAGGASVYHHLGRPASWGLFSRALSESGGYTFTLGQPRAAEAESTYSRVLNASGCTDVPCLQRLPSTSLLAIYSALRRRAEERRDPSLRLEPMEDGVDLTDQLGKLFAAGKVAPDVPLLAGATHDDLGAGLVPWYPPVPLPVCCPAGRQGSCPDQCTQADFRAYTEAVAKAMSGVDATSLEAAYAKSEVAMPGGNFTKWWWAAQHMGSDYAMICPARRSVGWWKMGRHNKPPVRSYLYLFSHVPDGPSGTYPKLAHHASEIPFVFRDLTATGPSAPFFHISRREIPLSDAIVSAWRSFAATGTPHVRLADESARAKQLLEWPPYAPSGSWMIFGGKGGIAAVQSKIKEATCDLWDRAADPTVEM